MAILRQLGCEISIFQGTGGWVNRGEPNEREILREMANCDLLIAIMGHRSPGVRPGEDLGTRETWIEWEWREADRHNVPRMAFLRGDSYSPASRDDWEFDEAAQEVVRRVRLTLQQDTSINLYGSLSEFRSKLETSASARLAQLQAPSLPRAPLLRGPLRAIAARALRALEQRDATRGHVVVLQGHRESGSIECAHHLASQDPTPYRALLDIPGSDWTDRTLSESIVQELAGKQKARRDVFPITESTTLEELSERITLEFGRLDRSLVIVQNPTSSVTGRLKRANVAVLAICHTDANAAELATLVDAHYEMPVLEPEALREIITDFPPPTPPERTLSLAMKTASQRGNTYFWACQIRDILLSRADRAVEMSDATLTTLLRESFSLAECRLLDQLSAFGHAPFSLALVRKAFSLSRDVALSSLRALERRGALALIGRETEVWRANESWTAHFWQHPDAAGTAKQARNGYCRELSRLLTVLSTSHEAKDWTTFSRTIRRLRPHRVVLREMADRYRRLPASPSRLRFLVGDSIFSLRLGVRRSEAEGLEALLLRENASIERGTRVRLLDLLARQWAQLGEADRSREASQRALETTAKESGTRLRLQMDQARMFLRSGAPRKALPLAREAHWYARRKETSLLTASTLLLARAEFETGGRSRARVLLEQVEQEERARGNLHGLAVVESTRCSWFERIRDLSSAYDSAQRAIALERQAGQSWLGVARALTDAGRIALKLHRIEEARQSNDEAIAIFRRRHHQHGIVQSCRLASRIALAAGDLDEAERLARESLSLACTTQISRHRAAVLADLGMIAWRRNELPRAITLVTESSQAAPPQSREKAYAALTLVRMTAAAGSGDRSILEASIVTAFRAANDVVRSTGAPEFLIEALDVLRLAHVYVPIDRAPFASIVEDAIKVAQTRGLHRTEARLLGAVARATSDRPRQTWLLLSSALSFVKCGRDSDAAYTLLRVSRTPAHALNSDSRAVLQELEQLVRPMPEASPSRVLTYLLLSLTSSTNAYSAHLEGWINVADSPLRAIRERVAEAFLSSLIDQIAVTAEANRRFGGLLID